MTAKSGAVKRYVSTTPTFVNDRYFKAGEPFETNAPKGVDWEEAPAKKPADAGE